MANSSKTGFLDLPAEIRNTIYDLALQRDAPVKPVEEQKQPAITRACRQIRAECLPLFYAGNAFVLDVTCSNCNDNNPFKSSHSSNCKGDKGTAADWVEAVGYRNLRHIKTIRLAGDNFDVTLNQDISRKRRLTAGAGSHWTEYTDNWPWNLDPKWCVGPDSPLTKMLEEVTDRKVEPGLSYGAVRKLVSLVCGDYDWYGLSEEELKEEKEREAKEKGVWGF